MIGVVIKEKVLESPCYDEQRVGSTYEELGIELEEC